MKVGKTKLRESLWRMWENIKLFIERGICPKFRKLTHAGRLRVKKVEANMIGSMEKGFKAAKVTSPPSGTYDGINLNVLPKYICFKAALLKEKVSLQYLVVIITALFAIHYCVGRIEISSLHNKLREKEYILAPGVQDFTSASAQSIPDSYVSDAVMDFLSLFGNVNPTNIDEQYQALSRFMSNRLKMKFDLEIATWKEQIKSDNLSQIFTVTEKEIISDEKGNYKVTALTRADFYTERQYLGFEDQVVEMVLKLTPPESGKRWYLQIEQLNWSKAETFNTKKSIETPSYKEGLNR